MSHERQESVERHAVAIVGNGVAGYACALHLARNGLPPLLIGPGEVADRPPLSKQSLLEGMPRLFADAAQLAAQEIERLDGWAECVSPRSRRVLVRVGGTMREIEAQVLVLALGLDYAPPPIPGLGAAHVNATPQGLRSLVAALDGARSRTVLVVGAGLVGVETAGTLAGLGHQVMVIDKLGRPLARLHEPLPALAGQALAELGVAFLGGVRLLSARSSPDGLTILETEGHGELKAEVLIAATGGRFTDIPGLPELETPIEVDEAMRVPGFSDLYAIGDCATPPHPRYGRLRLPHWDTAIGTANTAARAILGEQARYDRLPYWWSDIGPRRLAEVGCADRVTFWSEEDGLSVGRDSHGQIACVLVVDQPQRLREARQMLVVATADK